LAEELSKAYAMGDPVRVYEAKRNPVFLRS